jgi:protein-L-isoaspartate(D-aspartate) O-methyltransferase
VASFKLDEWGTSTVDLADSALVMSPGRASANALTNEIRPHVRDERVIEAVRRVPRELFVASELREEAWENVPLPIGAGQTISQPLVVARMCEVLELAGDERVLDVGTGSGYHAALLATLARWVWSIEREPSLARKAERSLVAAGIDNVTLIVGDGSRGYPDAAPYDAINVAAAVPDIPREFEAQLAPGGRLVAPLAADGQHLLLVRRANDDFERTLLEPVRFVPLVAGERPRAGIRR